MEDFQCKKAYLVAGGRHMTARPPAASVLLTYATVVLHESVRIELTLAALNDLKVKTTDIKNAFLTAQVGEKIWCLLGPNLALILVRKQSLSVHFTTTMD